MSDVYLPRLGGIELHVRDLAERQRARGCEAFVVTMTTGDGPTESEVLRPQPGARWNKARFAGSFSELLDRMRPDIVHAHLSTVSPLAIRALLAARSSAGEGPSTVVTVHSLWRRYESIYRAVDRAIEWSRWPVTWSAVSHSAAASVRNAAAYPLDVAVLPNGIDLSAWRPASHPRSGSLHVASVMRLAARKRPLPLLRMLRAIRARLPVECAMRATIIGNGPALPSMRRYLDAADMPWVELPGRLSRAAVADRLADADVYLAPSSLESFGIAALEARALGIPVVARRDTGIADFVVDGVDGALCGNDREMVEAVLRLAADGPSRVAPTASLARLDWPAVMAATEQLYASSRSQNPLPVGATG